MTKSTFSENQILYLLYALFVSFLFFGTAHLIEKKEVSSSYRTVKLAESDNDRKKHLLKRYRSQARQKSWWKFLAKS